MTQESRTRPFDDLGGVVGSQCEHNADEKR